MWSSQVGDVDDQRIALPAPARVPFEEVDVGADMRAAIGGNDAIGVGILVEDEHMPGRLNNLKAPGQIRLRRRPVRNAVPTGER